MRIEDGYLYCDRDEAERIVQSQQEGDEYHVVFDNKAGPWSTVPALRYPRQYHPVEGFVLRRRLDRCSPELLAHAGVNHGLMNHFI